jgi:hypothetical protein
MNKIFTESSLIPYKDGVLVVDKEAEINIGEYMLHPNKKTIGKALLPNKDYYYKIIASTVRIEGIPFMELPDETEKIKSLGYSLYGGYTKCTLANHVGGIPIEAFIAGYKAASKGYSEEDMQKAYNQGFDDVNPKESCGLPNVIYSSIEERKNAHFKNFLKSLQPKIKSIELEYEEENDFTNQAFKGIKMPFHLKVDNNNIIHPVKVEYE